MGRGWGRGFLAECWLLRILKIDVYSERPDPEYNTPRRQSMLSKYSSVPLILPSRASTYDICLRANTVSDPVTTPVSEQVSKSFLRVFLDQFYHTLHIGQCHQPCIIEAGRPPLALYIAHRCPSHTETASPCFHSY
jgi:hypothetical protein